MQLWSHQEKTLPKMLEKEQHFLLSEKDKKNIGLLCNDIGTGKTRTVLAYLLANPTLLIDYKKILDELAYFPLVICQIIHEYLEEDLSTFYAHARFFQPQFFHLHEYGESKPVEPDKGLKPEQKITILPSNLIVCPYFLFKDVWKTEIDKINSTLESKLTYYVVNRKTDKIDKEEFKKHTIILCNSNKYAELAKYCDQHRLKFQRVLYDEVNSVCLPNCLSIGAFFYWGITTTWTELNAIKNRGFIRDVFSHLSLEQLRAMMVRVDEIDPRCFNFKPFIKRTIVCKCSPDHQIINECYPKSKLSELMNEELFAEAKEYMVSLIRGGKSASASSSHSTDPLMTLSILELQLKNINLNRTLNSISKQQRTRTLLAKIFRQKICIRCNKDLSFQGDQRDDEPSFHTECCYLNYCFKCSAKVDSCPICLKDLKTDLLLNDAPEHLSGSLALDKHMCRIIELMKERYGVEDERALPDNCLSWLRGDADSDDSDDSSDSDVDMERKTQAARRSGKRKYFDPAVDSYSVLHRTKRSRMKEEIRAVEIESKTSECIEKVCTFIKDESLNKPDATLRIIENHPKSRILIFINNNKMTSILSQQLEEQKISYLVLNGMAGKIVNVLKKFKERAVNVLIVNGNHTGRGLNIPMADVQIIYDGKNQQTVAQETGRSQRHGRKKSSPPLEVYVLTHNKFNVG